MFLKEGSGSYKSHPTGAESLFSIIEEDPTMMRWPILVNYKTQQLALTQAGVRDILRTLVKERDKKVEAPQPPGPRPPRR